MTKKWFVVGNSDMVMEYRATLALEFIRASAAGLAMKEAIQERPNVISDVIDNAFAIADTFVDKALYRGELSTKSEITDAAPVNPPSPSGVQ